jgi:hypothetical protein
MTRSTGADAVLACVGTQASMMQAHPGQLLKRLVICGALGSDQEQ